MSTANYSSCPSCFPQKGLIKGASRHFGIPLASVRLVGSMVSGTNEGWMEKGEQQYTMKGGCEGTHLDISVEMLKK